MFAPQGDGLHGSTASCAVAAAANRATKNSFMAFDQVGVARQAGNSGEENTTFGLFYMCDK